MLTVLPHLRPFFDPALRALDAYGYSLSVTRIRVLQAISRGVLKLDSAPARWSIEDWLDVKRSFGALEGLALMVVAVQGYGVGAGEGCHPLYRGCSSVPLARRLFGRGTLDEQYTRLDGAMARLGYRNSGSGYSLPRCVAELLIWHRAPSLSAVTDESIARFAETPISKTARRVLYGVSAGLVELGILTRPVSHRSGPPVGSGTSSCPAEWLDWINRWWSTSSLSPSTRATYHSALIIAGRWLSRCHPEIHLPSDWTIDVAHDWVRHVTERRAGDGVPPSQHIPNAGHPLAATSKGNLIRGTRTLFRDLLEWEWIERRFDVYRAFKTPKQIQRALGPNPRPIDDAFWLKFRAAALALRPDDLLPGGKNRASLLPHTMVQAVATAWTFSGCRADEISRLELNSIYVEDVPEHVDPATGETMPAFRQAMLRVPANKTKGEFVKPVEMQLAEAISRWQRERPRQPKLIDRITQQPTDYLFCLRGHMLGRGFINRILIPILLRKVGLPASDSRGKITSHRARSTLATKLYSPTSGMAALEVMRWLGHTDTATGRYYVDLTPIRLMTAFHRSVKLSENLRFVGVMADTKAEPDQPVLRYDLGHGWCTNPAYSMCAHRMACARCSFYEPAESFAGTLARQKDRFVRMLQELDLTEDEREAVAGDADATSRLLSHLAGQPTPDRATMASESVPRPGAPASSPAPSAHRCAAAGL